jgi:2'-5' RNA ligase
LNIFNQANDLRKFHPHVTIAFRDLKKSAFYEMMEEYQQASYSAVFPVTSFYLLKQTGKVWVPFSEFCFIN